VTSLNAQLQAKAAVLKQRQEKDKKSADRDVASSTLRSAAKDHLGIASAFDSIVVSL